MLGVLTGILYSDYLTFMEDVKSVEKAWKPYKFRVNEQGKLE